MRIHIVIALLILSVSLQAQSEKIKQHKCSEVINELSYFWRLDSSGSNGFRLYTYELLLKSCLDSLKVDTLFSKLGKPNQTIISQKDVTYIYHYLNPKQVPDRDYGTFGAIYYIGFIQKNNSKVISNIYAWHLDL